MTEQSNKWENFKRFFRFKSKKIRQEPPAEPQLPDWKQQALSDFAAWLDDLPETPPAAEQAGLDNCDLYTLLSEFSALRQEIKFQNREQHRTMQNLDQMQTACEKSMALFENSAKGLDKLAEDIRQDTEKKAALPFLDVRDALVRGHAAAKAAAKQHRWYRPAPRGIQGVVEGYEMAIRRFDRALSYVGIAPLEAVGRPFDPKTMKAVGKRNDSETGNQIVVAEETGGFIRNGEVIRTAGVIVNEAQ